MYNIPKYRQVENYLIDRIKSGKIKIGDQIETEEDLVKKFEFSRMTINKALRNLSDQGYIERVPGKGSFVKATYVSKVMHHHKSFTEDMEDIGLIAGSELLVYKLVSSKDYPKVSERLNLTKNIPLHYFERLRTGNNTPIAISYNYISSEVLLDLSIDALNKSLYKYLRSIGYTILGNDLQIEATLPDKEQKKLLKIENSALLKTQSTTSVLYENEERILGYFETYYNGDLYTYNFNR